MLGKNSNICIADVTIQKVDEHKICISYFVLEGHIETVVLGFIFASYSRMNIK